MGEEKTEAKKEEKPKADMSAAAKKAWETRRKKYGKNGLSKKVEEDGKVASEKGKEAKQETKKDAKAEQLNNVIESQSKTASD